MKTTFREILKFKPCKSGWVRLCNNILDAAFSEEYGWKDLALTEEQLNTEVSILEILESNGVKDAFWALRTQDYRNYCLIVADIAESILHVFEEKYPGEKRPRKAITAIRCWEAGKITDQQLKKAAVAAADAAYFYTYAYADAYTYADAAYTYADAAAAYAYAYAAYAYAYADYDDAAAAYAYAYADYAYADYDDAVLAATAQWKINEKILRKYLERDK